MAKEVHLNELAGERGREIIEEVLATVRKHLGMVIAYLSVFVDDRSIFRTVDAPGLEDLNKPGDSRQLDEVYGNHITWRAGCPSSSSIRRPSRWRWRCPSRRPC